MALMTTTDWLAFWDSPHSIYVNARHKDVHYRLIAREIAARVSNPQAHVLDCGSGESLHADIVAAAAGELQYHLPDTVPNSGSLSEFGANVPVFN